jgi:hypothetical protein
VLLVEVVGVVVQVQEQMEGLVVGDQMEVAEVQDLLLEMMVVHL